MSRESVLVAEINTEIPQNIVFDSDIFTYVCLVNQRGNFTVGTIFRWIVIT